MQDGSLRTERHCMRQWPPEVSANQANDSYRPWLRIEPPNFTKIRANDAVTDAL
jgi:hypothetical protein